MLQKIAVKREFEAGLRKTLSKRVPFSNEGSIRQRKETDGFRLHQLCPRSSGL